MEMPKNVPYDFNSVVYTMLFFFYYLTHLSKNELIEGKII